MSDARELEVKLLALSSEQLEALPRPTDAMERAQAHAGQPPSRVSRWGSMPRMIGPGDPTGTAAVPTSSMASMAIRISVAFFFELPYAGAKIRSTEFSESGTIYWGYRRQSA